jgi:hypothetical protein
MNINKISHIIVLVLVRVYCTAKLLGIVDQYAAKHDILEKYYARIK